MITVGWMRDTAVCDQKRMAVGGGYQGWTSKIVKKSITNTIREISKESRGRNMCFRDFGRN